MNHNIFKKIKSAYKYNPNVLKACESRLRKGGVLAGIINVFLYSTFWLLKRLQSVKNLGLGYRAMPIANARNIQSKQPCKFKNVDIFNNSILIIAELSIPQCKKYRVDQKVAMMNTLGKIVTVVSWTDSDSVMPLIQTSGYIIFYRVPDLPMVNNYYQEAKRLGITTFFDVDDLIFNKQLLIENGALEYLSESEKTNILNGIDLYRSALMQADYGIASTKTLARQMENVLNKPVYLVRNSIDVNTLNATRAALITDHGGQVRIGYGSGTRTHDADFLEVEQALLQIMENYPNVEFIIYGYLEISADFNKFQGRVYRVPFVNASDYYAALVNFDITIAPLKDSIFNDCKSNIKYLESAIAQVACVCSPRQEFIAVVKNGENGYLADSTREWYDALEKLVIDKQHRETIASNAYRSITNGDYLLENIAKTEFLPIFNFKPKVKQRILMVNIFFAPDSFGGATIIVENLAKYLLHNHEMEVLVFCGSFNNSVIDLATFRYEVNGVTVVQVKLPALNLKSEDYNNPQIKHIFERLLLAWEADLVHFHSIQHLGANMGEVCSQYKIPYLITLHDAWWICERQFMLMADNTYCANYEAALHKCAQCMNDACFTHERRFYLKSIMDKASLLLAPSAFQRNLYIQSGIAPDKIKINKNGILPIANKQQQRVHQDRRIIRFAYLGGKAAHKGYFWLQDIIAELAMNNYILKLVDIESRLWTTVADISEWKVQIGAKVEIVPFFDQHTIDEFYAGIDVLLFPSQCKESFGLTVREAMLRDVWVISTDCGGPVEDIVENVNGNVTPFGDKHAFKAALLNILTKPEMLYNYKNPLAAKITLINDQVDELSSYYNILKYTHRL